MGSIEGCNFEWIGSPVECVYQSFNTQKYTFYRSFGDGCEIYEVGDFIIINRKDCEEVCKIKALYESAEERHRDAPLKAFIQPYLFAKKLEGLIRNTNITFKGNELVEDYDSVDIIISLVDIKAKCTVEFYPEMLPVKIIHKSEGYFCRYKYISQNISPVIPVQKQPTNCPSPSEKSKYSSDNVSDLEKKKHDTTLKQSQTNHEIPTNFRKFVNMLPQTSDESSVDEADRCVNAVNNIQVSPVRRNLCRSFNSDVGSDSYLNYSVIENSPQEEKVKIKLRVSRKTPSVSIDSEKLVTSETAYSNVLVHENVNKSIHEDTKNKISSPIVIIKNNNLLTYGVNKEPPILRLRSHDENQSYSPIRRSNRTIQRVSYADYVSPIKCTPPKRSRLLSEQSNTPSYSSLDKNKENIKSREKTENCCPCDKERDVSQYIDRKTPSRKCKSKYYYYTSETDDEDVSSNLIISGKRQVKTTRPFQELYESPSKSRKLETPKSRKKNRTPQRKIHSKVTESTPKSTHKKTPSSHMKLLRSGAITPSVQNRNKAISSYDSPLMKARNQLHVSFVPKALPCREKEYQDIYNFLKGKLLDGCGGCMYVSGVPGTGKTATVTSVINNLLEDAEKNLIENFSFVSINGMKLTEPRQAYVEIMRQLSKKTLPWEQAQSMLEDRFTKLRKKEKTSIVLLVDELDILCTKRQDVVYNLLDWPMKAKTQLIVITIANTMDLPERLLMNRVTSRLGLTRLTFHAYTHKQLQEIVMRRLIGTDSFNPDAIQLVARKVASVSGDARRALDICRRAAEIAELEGPDTYVSLKHVNEALNAMITQPKVQAIKHCSVLEQLVLQSIVAEIERTGVEETVFSDVFKMLISVSAINGFQSVNSGIVLAAVRRLSASRLLITDQKCSDTTQRIILNVSADDVYYALRKD